MRCIEMRNFLQAVYCILWLIETRDVLKFLYTPPQTCRTGRLIETWDVLKLFNNFRVTESSKRLIETWDVLKYEEKRLEVVPEED